jgi:hypothetical protein
MKRFIPQGDKIIVTEASFIAPQNSEGFTANQRYDLYCVSTSPKIHHGFTSFFNHKEGDPVYGLAENDDGVEFLVGNIDAKINSHVGRRLFSELVVFNVESSYDNHRAQKKSMRFRHMLIRAFVKLGYSYGWCDTKKRASCFTINRKRGYKHSIHNINEWARQMASPYFTEDGSLDRHSFMIGTPDHEINQEFFDELAYEELSSW